MGEAEAVGAGFSGDADGADGAGLGVGCAVVLPSRPRESAFASRLLLVLVGREELCGDALFGCGRSGWQCFPITTRGLKRA